LQATWQALQPVQMEVSTNIPFAIMQHLLSCQR
jgi:hypothetical protein